MKTYKITVYEANGEKLLEESFEASNDTAAKQTAEKTLQDKGYLEKTHRCTSSDGKLILFHV